jgi:hypothetical protein
MKTLTVYVPVTEFLENGGKLEVGRELFTSNERNRGFFHLLHEGNKVETDFGSILHPNNVYIQIQASPIYI